MMKYLKILIIKILEFITSLRVIDKIPYILMAMKADVMSGLFERRAMVVQSLQK